jgi:hypothetical protein
MLKLTKDQQDLLLGVVGNLLSALIGFVGGWILDRAKFQFQTRKAKRFWRSFAKSRTKVVMGRFHEFTEFEPSGLIGLGDAVALAELQSFFDRLGLPRLSVGYANRMGVDDLKQNLILLGGPDANSVTREVVSRIQPTIRFGDPRNNEISITDSQSGKVFTPRWSSESEDVVTDYGLVYKVQNPFSPDHDVLLIAGSFGYGTWAGVQYVTSPSFLEASQSERVRSFELLVEADVVFGQPQAITKIAYRQLMATSDSLARIESPQNPAAAPDC